MKLSIFLGSVLFATNILAAPRGLAQRVERRSTRIRNSKPLDLLQGSLLENETNVQYSSNWAGAVITSPPSGQKFNAVSGKFTVPTPSAPGDSSGTYSASAWVGIDGDTYSAAILQAGVDFTATTNDDGSTSTSYDAWYEWYPDYAYDFNSFSFTAGDEISVSITSSSSSAGKVVLENLTTGKTVTKPLTAPSSSSHLGGQNAEWIVEDFDEGGSEVSFADFGTVTFSSCTAKTASETLTASGATAIDIKQNGNVLTSVSVSGSTVTVTYE
jgi:hypothetical protein